MKNNFTKIQIILFATVLILACLAFIYLLRQMNQNEDASRLAEIELQTEALKRYEIKTLERSIQAVSTEITELETHFAYSSDVVPFLDTIEGLATKVGATAEVVSVRIARDSSGLRIGLQATGGFDELFRFLKLLENSPYELEFHSVNFKSDVMEEGVVIPTWEGSFDIKLLSFVI